MKLNKFVAGAALVAALGLGSIATTQTAEAASGSVTSYVANDPIVGVWIEVEGGGSGWATLTGRYQQRSTWSYNTKGRRFKAHIGVGGDHIN